MILDYIALAAPAPPGHPRGQTRAGRAVSSEG